jgi:hypothetical protein
LQSNSKSGVRCLGGVTVALLLVLAAAQPARSEPADWCALIYGSDGGYVTCGYATRAQCVEALSGVGGICHENPATGPADGRPAEQPHRRNRT